MNRRKKASIVWNVLFLCALALLTAIALQINPRERREAGQPESVPLPTLPLVVRGEVWLPEQPANQGCANSMKWYRVVQETTSKVIATCPEALPPGHRWPVALYHADGTVSFKTLDKPLLEMVVQSAKRQDLDRP